jgi:hypothetical protein
MVLASKVCVCLAILLSFAPALRAGEPAMEVFAGRDCVLFSGISDAAAKAIAKSNGFGDPNKWPVARTTGHKAYGLPPSITRRAKDHPEWPLQLGEYRVGFDTLDKERVLFFYNAKARVLIVVFDTHSVPEDNGEPSPFDEKPSPGK